MGFRISWMAVQKPVDEVIAAMGADRTGATGEYFDFPLSAGSLPDGWTIVWAEDESYFDPERSTGISTRLPLLSCWINETIMHSRVIRFERGEQIWAVWHEGDEDPTHIDHFGEPPADMASLIAKARDDQAADEGVDYLFDVPLEIAQAICGFKHDTFFGDVVFHEIVAAKEAPPEIEPAPSGRGWLSRLLGGRQD